MTKAKNADVISASPRIVIVSYNWPPRNAIGTQRPLSWARYWSQKGARITILTAKKYSFDAPLDLPSPDLHDVRVIEIPYLGPSGLLASIFRSSALRRHAKWIRSTALGRTSQPDARHRWFKAARATAHELAGNADMVVSSHGPSSAHMIAAEMKRANPRIRWIADYRDPWHDNHYLQMSASERLRQGTIERETIAGADCLTTVSEDLAKQIGMFNEKPIYVVENGFDLPETSVREKLCADRNRREGPIRIVYTGMIYKGLRDPEPLLQALSKMEAAGEIQHGQVICEFYGDKLQPVIELSKDASLAPFIDIMGHVSRATALQAQSDADLLLILESPDTKSRGVMTGKVFEYLASGSPILSVGPSADAAIPRLLALTGTGVSAGRDVTKIAAILRQVIHEDLHWYKPRVEQVLRFSRVRLADLMYSIVVGNPKNPPLTFSR